MNKEEINVDEVIRTIRFSEIAQKGYKVMSNDEFDRIVNGVLNLQQENQELINILKIIRKDINFVELCDGYIIEDKLRELERMNDNE